MADYRALLADLLALYEAPRDEIGGVEKLCLDRVRAALAAAPADPGVPASNCEVWDLADEDEAGGEAKP